MAEITTEAEWLACGDPMAMRLFGIDGRGNDCQCFRLFAIRWLEKLRPLVRFWDDIDSETLEVYAASVRRSDAVPAQRQPQVTDSHTMSNRVTAADHCFFLAHSGLPSLAAAYAANGLAENNPDGEDIRRQFCDEFRDLVGNPFRPVVFDPAWRTETVIGLAAGIDEAEAFERLPILADALEEAGCTHPQVLSHARDPGTHIRGCWLVDMILGRWSA